MGEAMTDPLDRIIWSADVDRYGDLIEALDDFEHLRLIKVDRLFLTTMGLTAIDDLQERGYRVFADAKLIEIPSKLEALARVHVVHRPWMLNCVAGAISNGRLRGGSNIRREELDGLLRFAATCREAEVKPCGVTVLTSKTEQVVFKEFRRSPMEQVLFYIEALIQAGFTDAVCSPQEAKIINERFGSAITLNTPGVRMADAAADDQARVMTPADAVAAGADRVIAGRPLTVGDKRANLERMVASLR